MICVANTKAHKLAGVTEQTQCPQAEALTKTQTANSPAYSVTPPPHLIWQAVPEPTEDDLSDATAGACQKIVQAGITSIHWLVISESELSIIQQLHDQDRLLFRVNVVVPEALLEKAVAIQTTEPRDAAFWRRLHRR